MFAFLRCLLGFMKAQRRKNITLATVGSLGIVLQLVAIGCYWRHVRLSAQSMSSKLACRNLFLQFLVVCIHGGTICLWWHHNGFESNQIILILSTAVCTTVSANILFLSWWEYVAVHIRAALTRGGGRALENKGKKRKTEPRALAKADSRGAATSGPPKNTASLSKTTTISTPKTRGAKCGKRVNRVETKSVAGVGTGLVEVETAALRASDGGCGYDFRPLAGATSSDVVVELATAEVMVHDEGRNISDGFDEPRPMVQIVVEEEGNELEVPDALVVVSDKEEDEEEAVQAEKEDNEAEAGDSGRASPSRDSRGNSDGSWNMVELTPDDE